MKPIDSTIATSALHKSSVLPEQTRFCPTDQEIARFYEGKSSEAAYRKLRKHVSECLYCQHRLGMLARLETDEAEIEVPEHLLASAKQMGRQLSRRNLHGPPTWAAAAVVVLALYWLMGPEPQSSQQLQHSPTAGLSSDITSRQLRSIDQQLAEPRILIPREGALVTPRDLVIKWTEIPGSLHYDLYIMNDEGDLILKQSLEEAQWSAGQTALFTSGIDYYARVEVQLPDNRSTSTAHVLFRVEEDKQSD